MGMRKEEKGFTLIEIITKKGGKKMKVLKGKKGFTLIEVIVILAVIAILAAVLTPMIIGYISDARLRAAESDTKTIATAVLAFNRDMNDWPIWVVGTARRSTNDDYESLKSSKGESPDETGITLGTTGTIDDHLVTNTRGYPTPTGETKKSRWIGPYLETVKQDPWGSKYYIDVKGLQPGNLSGTTMFMPAFVISAGPNKLLETAFGQPGPSITIPSGSDDILFRIK